MQVKPSGCCPSVLHWPADGVLFVADLHLGKAATYRSLGQPVPACTTRENLARLSQLLRHYQPSRLVFLGDLLHAAQARTPSVLAGLAVWRSEFAALDCTLVRGNHDSRAGDPPTALGIHVVDEPFAVGPFAACHHPQPHATHPVLAGHLHPVLHLRGPGRDHLRLPCFCMDAGLAILPAFGEFNGGWSVVPQAGEPCGACPGPEFVTACRAVFTSLLGLQPNHYLHLMLLNW